ncbi:hypothetical protein Droror1_Dr00024025 [Drosera rotundifolia]
MDKMVKRCIWNKGDRDRGWNLVAWSDTCQPKSKGGLGLRSARSNNVALLGKLVDNILHDQDKPWLRVITQRDVIAPGYAVYLGDGNSSFWYRNWLGTGRLRNRVPYVHISDSMIKVNDLWNNGTWNMGNLYTLLPHDLFEEINRIIILIDPQGVDTFRWKGANDGCYTTRAAYNWIFDDEKPSSRLWKLIWKCSVPKKDHHGRWLSGFSTSLGEESAFNAEILAIQNGLLHAWELGYRDVICYLDCKEAVDLFLSSDSGVHHWLRNVIMRIKEILNWGWTVVFKYIPRELNTVADAMARQASQDESPMRVWKLPPSFVIPWLCHDLLP